MLAQRDDPLAPPAALRRAAALLEHPPAMADASIDVRQ
jgi:hypothetical protein